MIKQELTYKLVNKILFADLKNGVLIWKKRDRRQFPDNRSFKSWNTQFAGEKAGSVKSDNSGKKYYQIRIFNRLYQTHRILLLIATGKWPDQVDHIDGNGLNNKRSNLRNVSHNENHKNKRLQSNNTSGVTGVGWRKVTNKWSAQIKVNNKQLNLGLFDDFFEAVCTRKAAELEYGFHKNHGSFRPL